MKVAVCFAGIPYYIKQNQRYWQEFIEKYKGSELDPFWLENVSKLKTRGWESFVLNFGDKIDEVRNEIAEIGQYIGIDISEFRRIVQQVQKGEKEARSAKKRWWKLI